MPATVKDSRATVATDPLRNFRFQVNINHTTTNAGSMSARLGFMTVAGLSMQTETISYRQGGMNAQPLYAKVLTTSGYKAMGDIQVGDKIVDPRGDESKVTGVFPQGVRPVYRVTMRDGSSAEGCHQHLWEVEVGRVDQQKSGTRKRPGGQNKVGVRVVNTMKLAEMVEAGLTVRVPIIQPVEYESLDELPIDPYVLGVLIAEGSLGTSVRFEQSPTLGSEVIERVRTSLPYGHALTTLAGYPSVHNIVATTSEGNGVLRSLRELGLMGHRAWEKFIPEFYLRASVADRLALLQGLMDGDGGIDSCGRIQFGSSSEALRDGVLELVRSLGGRATTRTVTGVKYTSPTQHESKDARNAYILASVQIPLNPFHMSAKADRHSRLNAAYQRRVMSVEFLGNEEVQCISVSADSHLYVTDNFVPTHNTTVQKMPGQTQFPPLSLSRGMMVGRPDQLNWMKEIFSVVAGHGSGRDFRCDINIYVLAHPWTRSTSVPVKAKYKIYNAWPESLAYSDLDAGGNALIMEQMVLQHEGFGVSYAASNDSKDAPDKF